MTARRLLLLLFDNQPTLVFAGVAATPAVGGPYTIAAASPWRVGAVAGQKFVAGVVASQALGKA